MIDGIDILVAITHAKYKAIDKLKEIAEELKKIDDTSVTAGTALLLCNGMTAEAQDLMESVKLFREAGK